MTFKNTSICLFLLGITFLGFATSQRITLPLKKNSSDQFFVSVKYGTQQCQIDLNPTVGYCSNTISQPVETANSCGSEFIGDNTWDGGKNFIAPFQLGNTQADLAFTIPSPDSHQDGAQYLCLGSTVSEHNNNALEELFEEKKITSRVVYFYENATNDENGAVGTLSIGEPIQQLSKGQFVELAKAGRDDAYTAQGSSVFTAFGQSFNSRGVVFISTNSPYTSIVSFAFDDLLKVFTQKGIQHTTIRGDFSEQTFLNTIDNLESLHFTLFSEDKSTFEVVLTPSQYTRELADGTFELLLTPLYYTGSISLGSTILQSYNIGFDLEKQRILIAEKQEAQIHNFRGASIKL